MLLYGERMFSCVIEKQIKSKGLDLMKKVIALAIAAVCISLLCACGNSSEVNNTVNNAKKEKIENMTAAVAAGTYTLSDMTDIGADKTNLINEEFYTENTIILTENGEYTLNVVAGDENVNKTGRYEITSDGFVTLDDGETYIAAKDEEALCNGETLIFAGRLGTQIQVNLVYKKNVISDTNTDLEVNE